jgi:hypothetical protein
VGERFTQPMVWSGRVTPRPAKSIAFWVAAAACTTIAAILGGGWAILLWPALVYAAIAIGYMGVGARVLGKRADGTRSPLVHAVMLPYIGVAWLIWRAVRRRKRIEPYDRIGPGILVSRRLYPHELPAGLALIVDFSAEFDEPRGVREAAPYLATSVLDGALPRLGEYLELVDRLAMVEGEMLLHCAAGHGRSATVAAGVLLRRGVVGTAEEAVAVLDHARPTADLSEHQREMVRAVSPRTHARRGEPTVDVNEADSSSSKASVTA